jgi:hypothetical protein
VLSNWMHADSYAAASIRRRCRPRSPIIEPTMMRCGAWGTKKKEAAIDTAHRITDVSMAWKQNPKI